MAEETKVCKYCQTEIPKKAKICPNCKKKQGIKTWMIVVGVILLLGMIGAASGDDENSSSSNVATSNTVSNTASSKANSSTPSSKPSSKNSESAEKQETQAAVPIEYTAVSVTELENAIQGNALKAANTYKDQYLEITGCLNVIDASGKYISINAGSDDWSFVNIQCYIKNDDQKAIVMDMSKGDNIVVKGKCKDVGEVLGYSIDIDELVK